MKKVSLFIKESHIRKLHLQALNLLVTEFGAEFQKRVEHVGRSTMSPQLSKTEVKEAVLDLQNLLDQFSTEIEGLDGLANEFEVLTPEEPQEIIEENKKSKETILGRVGKNGLQQNADGTWTTLD